ncbi:MAG: 30S ribosome-binding factor RbfA [Betaproteobacteria bacterium]|nr:30S ribosome-binding factor RbfA [Betaproteobacteria bacterium]
MPKDYSRALRIADQMQRELADIFLHEINDPRMQQITVTAVEVSRDYSHAKIYYTTLGSPEEKFLVEKGLGNAIGFLRSSLSHRIKLRIIPQLHFIYDESVERGMRLSKLIDEAVALEEDTTQSKPNC